MSVSIKIKDYRAAEAYCLKHIGPRMFYLHNKIGGQGWVINHHLLTDTTLIIEDEKRALLAALTLSDQ